MRNPDRKTHRPPALLHYLSEPHRASAEFMQFAAGRGLLPQRPSGDGRHVLVVPGLVSDDQATAPLRRSLRAAGYQPHGWGLGRNIGPTRKIIDGLADRLDELAERDGRPVSVVGWSLGGVLALDLALHRPETVERVITLGSPLNIQDPSQSRASAVYDSFAFAHLPDYSFGTWVARLQMPDVPISSIYTRQDGIVHWHTCLVDEAPMRENIEVYGSHCGLGVNLSAVYATLDRLGQPVDDWQKFQAPGHLRFAFPRSSSAAAAAA